MPRLRYVLAAALLLAFLVSAAPTPAAAASLDLTAARAQWIDAATVVWPLEGEPPEAQELLYDPEGRIGIGDDGEITMTLGDLVVVFNATPQPQTQQVALAGQAYALHHVQADGADETVKSASFDPATGGFEVPARTVAVFTR